jgi:hypothetical protein
VLVLFLVFRGSHCYVGYDRARDGELLRAVYVVQHPMASTRTARHGFCSKADSTQGSFGTRSMPEDTMVMQFDKVGPSTGCNKRQYYSSHLAPAFSPASAGTTYGHSRMPINGVPFKLCILPRHTVCLTDKPVAHGPTTGPPATGLPPVCHHSDRHHTRSCHKSVECVEWEPGILPCLTLAAV